MSMKLNEQAGKIKNAKLPDRPIKLNIKEYEDKVRGCWLGKNIGGTLGGPFEGYKCINALTFYDPVPDEPQPNDDLDLQLVWLKMLEDIDCRVPTLSDFVKYWLDYLSSYADSEYGVCLRNLERGLRPPVAGCFENGFIDNMGSPIRSEIWACIAPGDPQLAASLACRDALLDHAGGEGVYGEMFWAAVQSAAFVISDIQVLIRIGLSMIPPTCQISRAIREVLWRYASGANWAMTRDHISVGFSNPGRACESHGYTEPALAAPNHAYTIIGWLYGEDFEDRLLKAVNCGYDTDCTGATLGALLGIIDGASSLPEKWIEPVGNKIILYPHTGRFNHPETIDELTERTKALAEKFLPEQSDCASFGKKTAAAANVLDILSRNEKARQILRHYDVQSASETDRDLEIIFHYDRDPILYPNMEMVVRVSLYRNELPVNPDEIKLSGPKGWDICDKGDGAFGIKTESVKKDGVIKVKVKIEDQKYSADFMLLSPEKTTGYQWNVVRCPICQARQGACICNRK